MGDLNPRPVPCDGTALSNWANTAYKAESTLCNIIHNVLSWCAWRDSNPRHLASEASALSSWATDADVWKIAFQRFSTYEIIGEIGQKSSSGQFVVWLPLTTAFLQVQTTLYRTKQSQKPAMSQLSEASALSSWAMIAYIEKTPCWHVPEGEKTSFCTENKPLLTGYILCVRLAVERTKAGAKPL